MVEIIMKPYVIICCLSILSIYGIAIYGIVFKNAFPVMVRLATALPVVEFADDELSDDAEHMDVCGIPLPICDALGMSGFA